MKKSLLFCGVAALAFASCTQNEVLDVNENRAIGFESFVGKPTKALETSSLSDFYVFGAYDYSTEEGAPNVFNNVKVSNGTGSWKTEETKYWIDGKDYKFAAYSDENEKIVGATFTNGTLTIPYTVSTKDLVASNIVLQAGSAESNTAVGITLNHILAKVKFTFTNKLAEGYKIAISELKIASVPNQGTYTDVETIGGDASTPAGSWATSASSTTPDLSFTDIAAFASNATGASQELYVLPQNLSSDPTGLTVTFKATITDSNGTKVKEPSFTATIKPNWEMKYIYNYTLKLTLENTQLQNNVITFTPTVGGWTNADGSFEGEAPTIVP